MKIFIQLVIILLSTLIISSCKKSDQKDCWYLVDALGNIVSAPICGKSESEMNDEYGAMYGFYSTSDPLFCWKLTKATYPDAYLRNQPQYIVDHFFPGYTSAKVDCNSFCIWKIYFKHKSKITGLYTPTTTKNETLFNSPTDTCSTLYPGRIVVVSETADSIHTAEFVNEL